MDRLSSAPLNLCTSEPLCLECMRDPLPVGWTEAWGHYRGALERVLHAFKYERHDFFAASLAGLIETTRIFEKSEVARDWFGSDFVDHFAATREWEWRQWLDAVTDWEMKRYFEII